LPAPPFSLPERNDCRRTESVLIFCGYFQAEITVANRRLAALETKRAEQAQDADGKFFLELLGKSFDTRHGYQSRPKLKPGSEMFIFEMLTTIYNSGLATFCSTILIDPRSQNMGRGVLLPFDLSSSAKRQGNPIMDLFM
jgi:hypothetical protein